MKRVAIVMPLGYQRGGAEAMLMHLLRENAAMPKLDCQLFFLSDGTLVDEIRDLGYATTVLPPPGRLREIHRYAGTVLRLRRAFRQADVDSVLSWMANGHLYAGPAALSLGIPVFWFQHRIVRSDKMTRIYSAIPATGIFACSQSAADAQAHAAPRRPVVICHPAVDLAKLDWAKEKGKSYWRSQFGLPPDAPILGMVARLERGKGVHMFIEIARRLAASHKELHAFVVGGEDPLDPIYALEVRTLAENAGLGSRLRLVGHIPFDEIGGWWCAADVAVHSVTGDEGFGMSIVEAMAMGLPVIASAAGGPCEIIENGVNGVLCPVGDIDCFVGAIENVLSDKNRYKDLSREARLRAHDFSAKSLANCLSGALECMGERRA